MTTTIRPSVGAATTTGGTIVSPSKPTGTAINDLLVAVVEGRDELGSVVTLSTPSGWTLQRTDAVGIITQAIYTRIADGTEGASFSFSASYSGSSSYWYGMIATVIAIDAGGVAPQIVEHAGATANVSGTTVTAPSVATTAPNQLLLGVFSTAAVVGNFYTPPAGMTELSETTGNMSTELAYQTVAAVGSTGSRTATLGSALGDKIGVLIAISGNNPPTAPTGLSPSGSVSIDRTAATRRFSWTFTDPDPGDTQSQYALRYRAAGTADPWTTVTALTPNTFWDAAAGTFVAGNYEWQVQTYDAQGALGPWSSLAYFTAADPPSAPTITDPTAGSTIATSTYTVVWSQAGDSYQLRRVADDGAGAPDTATVYYDTGEVVSRATSLAVAFETNGRAEHIQVRNKISGLWSDWASNAVTVSYTPPATPTVELVADDSQARIIVNITNPIPTGSEPSVSYNDVYVREAGSTGAGTRIATDVTPSGTAYYWLPATGTDYEVLVRAWGSNGTYAESAWTGATVTVIDATATAATIIIGGPA